ncbi:MAG: hypothetical protein HC831_14455 [Chloroflexia bacterium]|nr:hypothetical protein [Chloroflexia bacterium]
MIEIDNLVYAYPKANATAVDNISFCVKEGEIFGFFRPERGRKKVPHKKS